MGRPAWILQAYALQNVVAWLLLAGLLRCWIPPDTPRGLTLWTACLFSPGMLASVRLALTDGPSMLLLAVAARTAAQHRVWTTAAVLGAAGLGRETNLLGLAMLPLPRRHVDGLRAIAAISLAVIPLLLWQDYLWSIYRSTTFANQAGLLATPFSGLVRKWQANADGLARVGLFSPYLFASAATLGLIAQAIYVAVRPAYTDVWWRLAAPYVVIMCLLDWVAWGGLPGAAPRVLLPLTIGFNVLLRNESPRRFWLWYAAGNIALLYVPNLPRL
jgi:hypothetical protein